MDDKQKFDECRLDVSFPLKKIAKVKQEMKWRFVEER